MKYTVGSLFTGIGGIDLAFSWAGFDVIFQVEIDEYCRKVLAKHAPEYWSKAKVYEDVHKVGRHNLETPDVLVGGFPCQSVSVAGKRAGIRQGTQSGLWLEFARIIGELRPRVILLENVTGIKSLGGVQVIGDLTRLGYDCTWQFVRAADIGAPHQRERWFCVGYRTGKSGNDINHHARKRMVRKSLSKSGNNGRSSRISTKRTIWNGTDNPNGRKPQARGRRVRAKTQNTPLGYTGINSKLVNTQSIGKTTAKQSGWRDGIIRTSSHQGMGITNSLRYKRQGRDTTRGGTAQITERQTSKPQYATKYQRRLIVKSQLGRASHGLSRRLDRHHGQFPARPNEPQYDYEPSRVTDVRENRVARIRALGNAVVPQQAYPFAVAIKAFLEAT